MAILLFALVVRVLGLIALDAPAGALGRTAWEWGAEQACMGESLFEGRGFGDPWGHDTGVSAWLSPVYPGLLAAAMKVGSGVSPLGAYFLFFVQLSLDCLICWCLLASGRHLGRPGAGVFAAWLWALYPLAVWHAVHTVWDTTIFAVAMAFFFERWFAMGQRRNAGAAALVGLSFGALLFVDSAALGLLPVLLAALVLSGSGGNRWVATASFCAAALLVASPWMLRNHKELDTWQLRPNYGVELMIGNHDQARGHPEPFKYHPSHIDVERARYLELGEAAYSEECAQRAFDWARQNPLAWASLSLRRTRMFWLGQSPSSDQRQSGGVGAAGDVKSWIKYLTYVAMCLLGLGGLIAGGLDCRTRLFLLAVLTAFGLPYYLSHVSERYRFPIDPLLVLLAGMLLSQVGSRLQQGKRDSAFGS